MQYIDFFVQQGHDRDGLFFHGYEFYFIHVSRAISTPSVAVAGCRFVLVEPFQQGIAIRFPLNKLERPRPDGVSDPAGLLLFFVLFPGNDAQVGGCVGDQCIKACIRFFHVKTDRILIDNLGSVKILPSLAYGAFGLGIQDPFHRIFNIVGNALTAVVKKLSLLKVERKYRIVLVGFPPFGNQRHIA